MPPSNKNVTNAGFVPVGSTNDGLADAADSLRHRKSGGVGAQHKEMLQQHFRAVESMRVYLHQQCIKKRISVDTERATNDGTTWRISYNDAKVLNEIKGMRVDKAVTVNVVGPTTSPTSGFANQIVVQVAISGEVAGAVVDARSNREFIICVAAALLALLVVVLIFLYSGGSNLEEEGIVGDDATASTQ